MDLEDGFRIGPLDVLPLEGRIAGPCKSVRVEPKVMEVLLELARHAPEVRTRRQIERAVWPRGYVSPDVLTRCIAQLRRALGDDPKAPAFLETIPKRGYRLCKAAQAIQGRRAVEEGIESLIVLPFRHVSPATEEFVADGLTELLILRLCGLRGVRVLSRTTSMQFKSAQAGLPEISARTGADWVIEGSVLQSGDRIQVVAQLIDARTDAHIWGTDYTGEVRDLLALQNAIAERVAAAMRARFGAAGARGGRAVVLAPATVRDYLRGRHLMSHRTVPALRDAVEAMAAVSAAAPDYAPAWASRAECEMLLMHYGGEPPSTLLPVCEEHIERALAIDPDLGIGHSVRGGLRFFFGLDFARAVDDLERALALLPSHVLALVLMANVAAVRQEFAEATAWIEQALLVDPLDVGVNMNLGDHMILQRRYAEAARALRQALNLSPDHRPSRLRLAWALALGGEAAAARAALAASGPNDDADAIWLEFAALVEAAAGDPRAAMKHDETLRRLAAKQRVPAWALARSAASAGRREAALAALACAAQERTSSWPFLRISPAFDTLHDDARFESLAEALPKGSHTDLRAVLPEHGQRFVESHRIDAREV